MNLVLTGDGSHTLYVPELDEHYHSTFGALNESKQVFIEAGFNYLAKRKRVQVLEVGFGTGLNALLTCMAAIESETEVVYYALDKWPVHKKIIELLNYTTLLPSRFNPNDLFKSLHQAPWNQPSEIHPRFCLHKICDDLITFVPSFTYDLVYFDAFAPDKQPEMWTVNIFGKLFRNLNPGGILTTYCVKGSVKRMLKSTGFIIEKLPGPPGKREILRGTKEDG